jgi:hypothetical protein
MYILTRIIAIIFIFVIIGVFIVGIAPLAFDIGGSLFGGYFAWARVISLIKWFGIELIPLIPAIIFWELSVKLIKETKSN